MRNSELFLLRKFTAKPILVGAVLKIRNSECGIRNSELFLLRKFTAEHHFRRGGFKNRNSECGIRNYFCFLNLYKAFLNEKRAVLFAKLFMCQKFLTKFGTKKCLKCKACNGRVKNPSLRFSLQTNGI